MADIVVRGFNHRIKKDTQYPRFGRKKVTTTTPPTAKTHRCLIINYLTI